MKTEHFYLGFDYPQGKVTKGQVFLNNVYFANFWQIPARFAVDAGKWELNRAELAIDLGFPPPERNFDSREAMLEALEHWFETSITAKA